MKVDVDSVDVAIEFEVCSGGSSCELQWLFSSSSNIKLSIDDKTVLTEGQTLNKHINYVQGILKAQFPEIEGLRCVVQILHTWGYHWIVTLNLQCEQGTIYIYDTAYSRSTLS